MVLIIRGQSNIDHGINQIMSPHDYTYLAAHIRSGSLGQAYIQLFAA